MALAGQAFAALLPLLLVVSAFSRDTGQDFSDELTERFELEGSSAAALDAAVGGPDGVHVSVSALGIVILLLSALSFTRALQRLYIRAWGLGKLGLRGNAWGLLWILSFILYFGAPAGRRRPARAGRRRRSCRSR